MTRGLTTALIDDPRGAISIAINHDNKWTPAEYLEVLYLRLARAEGHCEAARIRARIETVEVCFIGHAPDDPAWLKFRDWEVC